MSKEKQLEFWASHDKSGQRQRQVAQENLIKLAPELFTDVVFLEEYRPEGDSAA